MTGDAIRWSEKIRRRLPAIIFVCATAIFLMMSGLAFWLPMPGWVIGVPALVFAGLQLVAFRTRLTGDAADWAFAVGDYVYYLMIGIVLGLGSLVLEKPDLVAERFQANERSSMQQQLAATLIQIETTEAEILDQQGEISDRLAELTRANEVRAGVGLHDAFACEDYRMERRNGNPLGIVPDDFGALGRFETPTLLDPCLAVQGALLAVPRASDRLRSARDRLEQLQRIKTDAETRRDELRRDIGMDDDGKTWFWQRMTQAERDSLLFEWFPMLLLIGIATKLGKTSDTLLSKVDPDGTGRVGPA